MKPYLATESGSAKAFEKTGRYDWEEGSPEAVTKWAILSASLIITAGLAAIVALAPPAFFLSHLVNDQLLYFLMAKSVAQHGTPVVAQAVNLAPFTYAYGIAYLYAGVFKLFVLFEDQIRGIQAINLALIFSYMLLTLNYMAKVVPRLPVILMAGICGTAMLLDSRWLYIATMPNSDIVPALATVAAMFIAHPVFQPRQDDWGHVDVTARLVAIAALGGIGLFVKMSLVILPLVFVFLLLI